MPGTEEAGRPDILRLTYRRELGALACIIILHVLLAVTSLREKSVTIDEFAHLPAGLSYLETGDFRLYPHSPPLARMLAALPLIGSGAALPLGRGWEEANHWREGYEFMYANAARYQALFTRARLMMVGQGALLILLAWRWSRSLYGPHGGLAAAVLTAFSPNILAHDRLVTTDVGAALFFAAAVYCFWRMLEKPTAGRGVLAGIALGLALLTKFTCLLLVPLLIALAAGYRLMGGGLPRKKTLTALSLLVLASWLTLNAGYLWQGTGRTLSTYRFESGMMKKLGQALPGKLPVLLPYDFVHGLDLQNFENEQHYTKYLFGQTSEQGWTYYLAAAMAVKMTDAAIALIALAAASLFRRRERHMRDEIFIILPPILVVAAISLGSQVSSTLRYVLPAFPFLFIATARLFRPGLMPRPVKRFILVPLLALHLVSNLLIYPDYLAYFNFASGGPKNGANLLVDSNIDWGQDLIGLKRYMKDRDIDRICLAYFGRVDPAIYGIDYEFPHGPGQCRTVAISVTLLKGVPSIVKDGNEIYWTRPGQFDWLKSQKPAADIGHSIEVFDLDRR